MALEIGAILLEAAISLAKSAWDAEDNLTLQEEKLTEIAETVTEIRTSLVDIHALLTAHDPPPEVARFRRARTIAASVFHAHWDHTLLDFATELLSLLMHGAVSAVRLAVDAVVHDPDTPISIRYHAFHVVILASKTLRHNAARLTRFFSDLLDFNNSADIPHRKKPCMTVSIARGPDDDFAHFDRLKNRLTIRLLMLSTLALGWGQNFFGSVDGPHVYKRKLDPAICKHIVVHDVSDAFALGVARGMRTFVHNVGDALTNAIHRNAAAVRIVFLSQSAWVHTADLSDVHHITDHVRTFLNREGIKCLEMLMGSFDDWDRAMLRTVLLHALSASILVFRFESLTELGEHIGHSKEITDRFPGLTADVERIMFVDTATTSDFRDVRIAVQGIAVERRLHQPRTELDILFEAPPETTIVQDTSDRARGKRSILNCEIKGACRKHLERVVHIFNREISSGEALKESEECIDFALRLKSRINTKVTIMKDPDLIKIARGDSTGYMYSNTRPQNLMRESEYNDFRDVTANRPFTIDAIFKLSNVPPEMYTAGRFQKWPVVTRMAKMVQSTKSLYITVVDEKKTVLEHGQNKYITALQVTILGGGMEDFLSAKAIRSCLDAVRADQKEGSRSQMAVRTLLRLVPELAQATRRSSGV